MTITLNLTQHDIPSDISAKHTYIPPTVRKGLFPEDPTRVMGKNKKKTQNAGKAKAAVVEKEVEAKEVRGEEREGGEGGLIGGDQRSEDVEEVQGTVEDGQVGSMEVAEGVAAIPEVVPVTTSTKEQAIPMIDDSTSSATHDTNSQEHISELPASEIPDTQAEPAQEKAVEPVVTGSLGKLYATPIQAPADLTQNAKVEAPSETGEAEATEGSSPVTNAILLAEEVDVEQELQVQEKQKSAVQESVPHQHEDPEPTDVQEHTQEEKPTSDNHPDASEDLFGTSELAETSGNFFDQVSTVSSTVSHPDAGQHQKAPPQLEIPTVEQRTDEAADLFSEPGPAKDRTPIDDIFDAVMAGRPLPPLKSSAEPGQARYTDPVIEAIFDDAMAEMQENTRRRLGKKEEAVHAEGDVVNEVERTDAADDLFGTSASAEGGETAAFFDQPLPTEESAHPELSAVDDQQGVNETTMQEPEVVDDAADLFGDVAEDPLVHEFEIAVEQTHVAAVQPQTSNKQESTENAADSADLFGQSTGEEDLFGNEWEGGPKDDLFGVSQEPKVEDGAHPATQSGDEEDDLFGSGGDTHEADEILGASQERETEDAHLATRNGDTQDAEDDLFGSGGDANAAEDLFGAAPARDLDFISAPTHQEQEQPQPAKQRVEDMDLDAAGVPQGWVDEQGGWNWYSAEERLDVARGMFGETQDELEQTEAAAREYPAQTTATQAYSAPTPATNSYSVPPVPSYAPPVTNTYQPSVPSSSSLQVNTSAYDPYKPSASTSAPLSAYTSSGANGYSAYQRQPSTAQGYANTPVDPPGRSYSPYDPPPAIVAKTAANVFKPAAPVITAASPYGLPSPANAMPTKSAPPPTLNRMKTSTAYDPPMIPMAKAVSRPASAAPVITPFAMPTLPPSGLGIGGLSTPNSAPPGVTPPPPAGPPRGPSRVASPANTVPHSAFSPPTRKPQQVPSALAHPIVPNAYDPPALPVMPNRPASRVATPSTIGLGMPQSPAAQQMNVLSPPPPRSTPNLMGPPRAPSGVLRPPPARSPSQIVQVAPGLPRIQAEPPTPLNDSPQPSMTSPPSQYAPSPIEQAYPAPLKISQPPLSQRVSQPPPRSASPLSPGIPRPNYQAPPFSRPSSGMKGIVERPPSTGTLSPQYPNENRARMSPDDYSQEVGSAQTDASHDDRASLETHDLTHKADDQNVDEAEDPEGGAFDFEDEEEEFTQYSAQSAKPRPALQQDTFAPPPIAQTSAPSAPAVSYDPYAPKPHAPVEAPAYTPSIPPKAASIPFGNPTADSYSPYSADQQLPRMPSSSYQPSILGDVPAPSVPNPARSIPVGPFGHSPINTLSHSAYDPVDAISRNHLEEDSLARSSVEARRVPSVSFGPNGTLVVAFQRDLEEEPSVQNTSLAYGDDSKGLPVHIRRLADSLPPPIEQSGSTPWPGPLLTDPQASKTSAAEKKKRDAVNAFLAERIQEIESGLPYLSASGKDVVTRANQEAMMLLYQVAQLMLKHDGKILTSDPAAHAELKALLPKLSSSIPSQPSTTNEVHGVGSASDTHFLSESLLKGDQQAALQYAMDHHLWSHALLLAAGIDPATWTTTVSAFVQATVRSAGGDGSHAVLATAYSIYGQGGPAVVDSIPADDLPGIWRNSLATIVASSKPNDATYIVALAEKLKQHGLVKAAHLCYVLSPVIVAWQQSRADSPLALVGSSETDQQTEATLISEILEYAIWLRPVAKGTEAFHGVPGLLQYKLNKAATLFATGDVAQAKRYCDAVVASLRMRKVPDAASQRIKLQLQNLLSRINGEEFNVSSAKGLPKPKLENLGSWFEGTITKFIAGDEVPSTDPKSSGHVKKSSSGSAGIGPFTHFSAITPESTPALPSRAMSSYDIPGSASSYAPTPIQRSGSAMSYRPQGAPKAVGMQQRPTSAMAYRGPESRLSALSQVSTNAEEADGSEPAVGPVYQRDEVEAYKPAEDVPAVEIPSWGQSYTFDDTDQQEPKAEAGDADAGSFINPMTNFITPAASVHPSAAPTPPATYAPRTNRYDDFGDDDDDLGLGNSSSKKKPPVSESTSKPASSAPTSNYAPPPPKESPVGEGKQEDDKPKESPKPGSSGGSWLGRLWGKGGAEVQPAGPVKAKLGNESSMYYDKELKRWVTKGQQVEAPKATPPPPRPAAKPKPATPTVPSPSPVSTLPPSSRPPSAIPPSGPLRSAAGTPPSIANPPSSRPASGAANGDPPMLAPMGGGRKPAGGKKSIKARYVEIT